MNVGVKCSALLDMWYPGQLGGRALAQLLFGDVSPSGKLPVTFYKSADLLPDIRDYSMKNRTYRYCAPDNVLYPFGYGLSYAEFTLTQPEFTESSVSVSVANKSGFYAEDVVQLYIRGYSEYDVPNGALCGFERIGLAPGENRVVTLDIPPEAFDTVLPDGSRRRCGTHFTLKVKDGTGTDVSGEIML